MFFFHSLFHFTSTTLNSQTSTLHHFPFDSLDWTPKGQEENEQRKLGPFLCQVYQLGTILLLALPLFLIRYAGSMPANATLFKFLHDNKINYSVQTRIILLFQMGLCINFFYLLMETILR